MMKKLECIIDLQEVFPTKQSSIDYLEQHRWNGKVTSPYDPTSEVYKLSDNWYKCKNTGKKFNVKTGTMFKNTKIPLRKWFYALFTLATKPDGISSIQLGKDIKITQSSAWNLKKDLRSALKQSSFIKSMLKGFVEIDETFMGGKNKWRHWNKKAPKCQGRNWKDKTPVLVIIERGGNVIVLTVPNTKRKTLEPIIKTYVEKGADVFTDEWLAYKNLDKWYNHQIVIHKKKQYAKQYENVKVSVNLAENFNRHLKKSIYGTHHWVSKKHLQSYVDRFAFYCNTRRYSEQERFNLALLSIMGKSPGYKELNN